MKCPPGKKPGDVVGVKVTEEDRKRMKEGARIERGSASTSCRPICRALPFVWILGEKTSPTYSRRRPTTGNRPKELRP